VVVNTIHGPGNLAEKPGLKELLYTGMCRLSDRVVAVCPFAYRKFRDGGVIPKSKLIAINNGIPLDTFLNVRRRSSASEVVFGIVGRLVPVKDHRSLLAAFARVVERWPECRLEILGDGPLRSELEALAGELQIAQRTVFHGFSADVPRFLSRIHVFVLCSLSEGLPLSVLEAMAAGLPIVGTSVGGIPDLVQDGHCGWLCSPSDPASLADAMLQAVDAGTAGRELKGEQGRRHAADNYSLQRMTLEYEQLFARLLPMSPAMLGQPS